MFIIKGVYNKIDTECYSLSANFVYDYTNKKDEIKPYNIGGNILGYINKNKHYIPLPFPLDNIGMSVSANSYMGMVLNTTVSANSTLGFKPLFLDKDIVNESQSAKVGFNCIINGKRADLPSGPRVTYNADVAAEIIRMCETYYNEAEKGRIFSYGKNFITYHDVNVANLENGSAVMQCDTFVFLVMMGIRYEQTPFASPNVEIYTFKQLMDKIEEDAKSNPDKYSRPAWALSWEYSDLYNRQLSWTGGQNWWLWNNRYVFKNISNAKKGDIVIFRRKPTSSVIKNETVRFDNIKHIGIIDFKGTVPYIYHVTAYPPNADTSKPKNKTNCLVYEPLAGILTRRGYDLNEDIYFCKSILKSEQIESINIAPVA